jgi:hypothetical protein
VDAGFQEYGVDVSNTFTDLCYKVYRSSFFRVSYTPLIFEIPCIFDLARVIRNMSLVLEECDRFDDPRFFQEYDEIISRGRHYGVSIIAISLYPSKIPAMLRRQATRLISFRQHEPADIQYIGEVVGEHALQLPDLEDFSYLDWKIGEEPQIVKCQQKS